MLLSASLCMMEPLLSFISLLSKSTLSTREICLALGMLSKPPLISTDTDTLWCCCGHAGPQGKIIVFNTLRDISRLLFGCCWNPGCVHFLGWNCSVSFGSPWLLRYCQISPPKWCQSGADRSQGPSANGCGPGGIPSSDPRASIGPPSTSEPVSCGPSYRSAVGWSRLPVFPMDGITSMSARKKRLFLWYCRTQRDVFTPAQVNLQTHF